MHLYCVDLRTKSDYFSLYSINLSVFIAEAESVYCAVRTGPLNKTYVFVLIVLKAGEFLIS
jgi:hypothetical protein